MDTTNIRQPLLSELIEVAQKFRSGELTPEDLDNYSETMVIRSYVPLQEKIMIALNIVTRHQIDSYESVELKIGQVYVNLFFYGLLFGYGLVQCEDENLISLGNYDLLFPIFGRYLLEFCKDDYEILTSIVKDSINLYRAQEIVEALETIDYEALNQSTNSNREFLETLEKNDKIVANLADIMKFNDPLTKRVVDELKKINVEKVMSNVAEENKIDNSDND